MIYQCIHCNAFYWGDEKNSNRKYTKCCMGGKIVLPPMSEPSSYMKELLLNVTEDAKIFNLKSRAFNTSLSFASISTTTYKFHGGVPTYRIQGAIYHNIGSIYPEYSDNAPRNLQLYFHDNNFNCKF